MSESVVGQAVDEIDETIFEATDVQWDLPAGTIARSIAAKMALPDDAPWGLRSDRTSTVLDDDIAIGDQIESESEITIFPRSHLGGRVQVEA